MKFQIQRENLLEPLQNIIGAVEKRQTMPTLSNVCIRASDNELTLTTTDLEIELVTRIAMAVDEPGEITVPARKLLDICKTLPAEAPIKFSLKDDKATVVSGRSRFSLATLPAADFPVVQAINADTELEIPQRTLRELIDDTAFAMAQQDVRYYLNGLLLEVGKKLVRAVATDGHRLAFSEKPVDIEIADSKQVILPRKGVLELMRLLEDSDEPVKLSLGSNHLQAEFGTIRFTSKLIDGRFPDYNRVIPQGGECIVQADRDGLRQALVRASILSNEKYRGIRLILDGKLLKLQAQNPEQEEADIELEVDYTGPDLEIGFNVNYMIDVLNSTDATTVQAALKDSSSSCLLTFPDRQDCKYVIMPMRL